MNIDLIVDNIKKYDYSLLDVDDFLDNRDKKEFDSEWLNIFNQIDRNSIPEDVKTKADKYRKEVFLAIDRALGSGEMSEYISDDIELLIFADYLNITNNWLNKLIEVYETGGLPTGILVW